MRWSIRDLLYLLGMFGLVLWTRFCSNSVESHQDQVDWLLGEEHVDWSIFSAGGPEEEPTEEAACSLRNVVRNDVRLRDKFRFSSSVLQWKQSFSKAAWEHLKTRYPPYGWKGLPVNVLLETLSLLNSSCLFRRDSPVRCVRCAVVGNGGILRGSGQGSNIDSHDFVFRVNGAVTRGFEDDVGTKTSFYGFTANTMKHALSWYRKAGFNTVPQSPEIKYIFIPSDLRDYVMLAAAVQGQTVPSGTDKGDRTWKYFGHKPAEGFKFLHPAFIYYVTHSFLSSRLMSSNRSRHLYRPSTGALMLLTALHTCDQVSAYGFITRRYAAFSEHYYDGVRRRLRFFLNHDLKMELRLWEALHRRGVFWLYRRRGGKTLPEFFPTNCHSGPRRSGLRKKFLPYLTDRVLNHIASEPGNPVEEEKKRLLRKLGNTLPETGSV